MRAGMPRRSGINPRHEALRFRRRASPARTNPTTVASSAASTACASTAPMHPSRTAAAIKSRRRRIAGHGDGIALAHATCAPDKALHDGQVTVRFAISDQRAQCHRAVRLQAHMGREQRIAVSFRSGSQRLAECCRLDGPVDFHDPIKIAIGAMRQGQRDAIRRRPAMAKEHRHYILQSVPVERGIHGRKPLDPIGKGEAAARKRRVRMLQDREQVDQSKTSSASAIEEMTRRSRSKSPRRARYSSIGASMATMRASPAKRTRQCRLPA